jgi:hypothetical protein
MEFFQKDEVVWFWREVVMVSYHIVGEEVMRITVLPLLLSTVMNMNHETMPPLSHDLVAQCPLLTI